jgi:phosphoribosylglycinamide formyltransferase-1
VEPRVAVLASGEGTNLQALLDDGTVGPWIRLVISDRRDARALQRARSAEVEAVFLDPKSVPDRNAYDRALRDLLDEWKIGVVALAGFMRILGPGLVGAYEGRILNIHPALLPSFPGAHAIEDALEWGAKVTGVTVHLVDEQMDHGPIVLQEAVAVRDDDDRGSLASRIHEVEHRLYKRAVRALVEGRVRVDGRRVRIEEAEGD